MPFGILPTIIAQNCKFCNSHNAQNVHIYIIITHFLRKKSTKIAAPHLLLTHVIKIPRGDISVSGIALVLPAAHKCTKDWSGTLLTRHSISLTRAVSATLPRAVAEGIRTPVGGDVLATREQPTVLTIGEDNKERDYCNP